MEISNKVLKLVLKNTNKIFKTSDNKTFIFKNSDFFITFSEESDIFKSLLSGIKHEISVEEFNGDLNSTNFKEIEENTIFLSQVKRAVSIQNEKGSYNFDYNYIALMGEVAKSLKTNVRIVTFGSGVSVSLEKDNLFVKMFICDTHADFFQKF